MAKRYRKVLCILERLAECEIEVEAVVVGNVIAPRMQGQNLNLDPVVVLLSLALWGALWGVPGMFLSTPLTVMAMVVLAQFQGTHWVAVLLSSDGRPEHISEGAPDPPPPPNPRSDGPDRGPAKTGRGAP